MFSVNPRDPKTQQRIAQLRTDTRLKDARPTDGRCGHVAKVLEIEFGWLSYCGHLLLRDRTVSWVHCWNVLLDKTIVDATADQFGDLWIGSDLVVEPYSPLSTHYCYYSEEAERTVWDVEVGPSPRVRWSAPGDDGELVDGGEFVVAVGEQRPWFALADRVLHHLTGWQVHDQVIALTARTLRAVGATSGFIHTPELLRPLVDQNIQHLGRRSPESWIAPEFRDPV